MSQEISCFDITCQQTFVSIEGLRDHFFLKHPVVTVFKCRFGSLKSMILSATSIYSNC